MNINYSHIPVMLNECINGLNIEKGKIFVDGTLGGCGHTMHIIKNGGKVIGIDRDITAINNAKEKLQGLDCITVHDNYSNIINILRKLSIPKIDGALLDLGVSSYQLDTPERGFSYRYDAPLDMRMDQSDTITAKTIINEYSADKLTKILFDYGEEPFAHSIVNKIIEHRNEKTINTTFELVDIIKSAVPAKIKRCGKHPAKRTFQAIRIAVNNELSVLEQTINDFCDSLNPKGRLAIITFHSLEDRIVKIAFNNLAKGCTCPPDFPVCVCGKKPKVKIITKKPILPSQEELEYNPRSASAKLRIIEKL